MKVLPVEPAWRLAERAPELRWPVTHLCSQEAVGIAAAGLDLRDLDIQVITAPTLRLDLRPIASLCRRPLPRCSHAC